MRSVTQILNTHVGQVRIDGPFATTAATKNGCLVVQCDRPIGVEALNPRAILSVNPAGDESNPFKTTGRLTAIQPGEVLCIFTENKSSPAHYWQSDWPELGDESRSRYDNAIAIAAVEYEPRPDQFFPCAIGRPSNPLIQFARQNRITTWDLKLDRLPRVFPYRGDGNPQGITFELVAGVFGGFCGELFAGWNTDNFTPAYQHPGYGRNLALWTSRAALLLCSNVEPEMKRELAHAVVQWGLDLGGAFVDGRKHIANGGHMQGRTMLVMLAGHLLGIPQLEDPSWLGLSFQERSMWYESPQPWWDSPGWKHFWQRTSDHRWGATPEPLHKPPVQWSSSDLWAFGGYYEHAAGANIGTAIVARLLGLEGAIGRSFCAGILDQFMNGPPSLTFDAMLVDRGVKVPWCMEWKRPQDGMPGFQESCYRHLRRVGL